jgi:uncharacterized alpha/beta hydrolase family protein
MKIKLLILLFAVVFQLSAVRKVYLIHGYGGLGLEMEKINKAIQKEGFTTENYVYLSMVKDVDTVGRMLFEKIRAEKMDTVSFVTHSMGALVVRAMYHYLDSATSFPFVDRVVKIAPPNNGSPVADYFAQFSFLKCMLGPNINNLTTNAKTGAGKYPLPTCEVGLIAGSYGGKKGFNALINADNDGVLLPDQTKMGIEKDIAFIKSWHVGLLFNTRVVKYTIAFLKTGKFRSNP